MNFLEDEDRAHALNLAKGFVAFGISGRGDTQDMRVSMNLLVISAALVKSEAENARLREELCRIADDPPRHQERNRFPCGPCQDKSRWAREVLDRSDVPDLGGGK